MSEEEIKELKKLLFSNELTQYGKRKLVEYYEKQIEEQQAELEKKDKIIDLMADKLAEAHEWFYSEFDNYTKEDFKQYFENQLTVK